MLKNDRNTIEKRWKHMGERWTNDGTMMEKRLTNVGNNIET